MKGESKRKRTTKVTTQHKVQHEKAILIVLERIAHIDNEWMIDLPVERF